MGLNDVLIVLERGARWDKAFSTLDERLLIALKPVRVHPPLSGLLAW
jgi:hypothetical protein